MEPVTKLVASINPNERLTRSVFLTYCVSIDFKK
jgi:hypothetical protein